MALIWFEFRLQFIGKKVKINKTGFAFQEEEGLERPLSVVEDEVHAMDTPVYLGVIHGSFVLVIFEFEIKIEPKEQLKKELAIVKGSPMLVATASGVSVASLDGRPFADQVQ